MCRVFIAYLPGKDFVKYLLPSHRIEIPQPGKYDVMMPETSGTSRGQPTERHRRIVSSLEGRFKLSLRRVVRTGMEDLR